MDKITQQLREKLKDAEAQVGVLQRELQQTRETLRSLKRNTERYLDLAQVILVALDDKANITMMGGSSHKLLGYKPADLIGKNWFKVCLPSHEYDRVFDVYRKLMAGEIENTEYFENDIRTKAGQSRHIAWHNSLLKDDNGKIIGTLSSGIDITERKRVEEALRQSEAHFRKIFDVSPVPFALNDDQHNVTYLNPAFIKTFGYRLDDIPTLEVWHSKAYPDEEYRQWVIDTWRTRLNKTKAGAPFEPLELEVRCKDSTRRTVLASTASLEEYLKDLHLVVLYDITERKRVEHALRESERKYRLLFENMTSGFALHEIITDKDGKPVDYRYLEINPGFEKLTNVAASALLGKTIREVMPDTEDYWIETFGRVAQTGESIAYENYSREIGRYFETWVFSPQKNQFAVIFSDCTERKLAEQALQDTQKMLEKAQEIAHVGSWTWDFATQKSSWSDEMYRIFDITREAFDGTNNVIEQVIHPDDRQLLLDAQKEIMKTGRPVPLEYRIIRKDGSMATVYSDGDIVFGDDGKPVRMVGTVQDITQQREQEEQLRRSQKMDALGKLTGGIAHDYNNMVGVILGYSQLLKDALTDEPQLNKYAAEIYRAAMRGSRLSRKLLAFSRNIQTESAVVDINALLIAEQDLLQKTLTPRILLKMDLDKNIWPVNLNGADFEDAVLNLSINAMHAMPDGGALTISTANSCLDSKDLQNTILNSGDYVMLKVTDTGCGMDLETQGKIFDPFFTTKGDEGVGLGLSMVFGFVRRAGGDISVTSRPGEGSEFVLYFPRCPQEITARSAEAQSDNRDVYGHETILVVDDEPAIVDLARDILLPKGYRVLTAGSGEEALQILDRESIDLLISDVIMPGMTGYQLANIVQAQYPDVKIQLMSGYSESRQAHEVAPALLNDMLQKPFIKEALLKKIRGVLGNTNVSQKDARRPLVMIVDDDENARKLFQINLEKLGYDAVVAKTGEEAISLYQQSLQSGRTVDVSILDLSLAGGMDGQATARKLLEIAPKAKLIVSSGDSFGPVMTNYHDFGFKGAIEKDFNRSNIKCVLEKVLSSNQDVSR